MTLFCLFFLLLKGPYVVENAPQQAFPLSEAQALFVSQYNPAGPFKVEPRWQEAVWSVQGKGRKAVAVCQVPLTTEHSVFVAKKSEPKDAMQASQSLYLTKRLRDSRFSASVRYETTDPAEPKEKGFSGIAFYTPFNSNKMYSAERYVWGKRTDVVEYGAPRPPLKGYDDINLYYVGAQQKMALHTASDGLDYPKAYGEGPGQAWQMMQKLTSRGTPNFMGSYRVFSRKSERHYGQQSNACDYPK